MMFKSTSLKAVHIKHYSYNHNHNDVSIHAVER